jgi:hypothetical protein
MLEKKTEEALHHQWHVHNESCKSIVFHLMSKRSMTVCSFSRDEWEGRCAGRGRDVNSLWSMCLVVDAERAMLAVRAGVGICSPGQMSIESLLPSFLIVIQSIHLTNAFLNGNNCARSDGFVVIPPTELISWEEAMPSGSTTAGK